jgi:hypothetical protein
MLQANLHFLQEPRQLRIVFRPDDCHHCLQEMNVTWLELVPCAAFSSTSFTSTMKRARRGWPWSRPGQWIVSANLRNASTALNMACLVVPLSPCWSNVLAGTLTERFVSFRARPSDSAAFSSRSSSPDVNPTYLTCFACYFSSSLGAGRTRGRGFCGSKFSSFLFTKTFTREGTVEAVEGGGT